MRNFFKNSFKRIQIYFFIILISQIFLPLNAQKINNSLEKDSIDIEYFNQKKEYDYILDTGDIIKILISRELPELTGQYLIGPDGHINMPILEKIYIAGLSVDELINLLNKNLSQNINYPNVRVEIIQYRPVKVVLDGEVSNPGLYNITGSFVENEFLNRSKRRKERLNELSNFSRNFPTVFDALQSAGGITEFSDLSNVRIIRKNKISNGGGYISTNLNFLNVIENGDQAQNIRIFDGDRITVSKSEEKSTTQLIRSIKTNINPLFINVHVSGRVNSPGKKTIGRVSSLNDALYVSGGTKILKGSIIILRVNNDGTFVKNKIRYSANSKKGSRRNPFLRNGDIIFVNKGSIGNLTEVTSEIFSPPMLLR